MHKLKNPQALRNVAEVPIWCMTAVAQVVVIM